MSDINDVELFPQKNPKGDFAEFGGKVIMTGEFVITFGGEEAVAIANNAILKIRKERVLSLKGACYEQICMYDYKPFIVADIGEVILVCMLGEY